MKKEKIRMNNINVGLGTFVDLNKENKSQCKRCRGEHCSSVKMERGITLIALVITIIILLILAGVTISLTLGDNGLFSTAKRAVSNYANATEQELEYLNEMSNINNIIEGTKQRELVISIDNINSKGCKINITNTKSIDSDDVTFEYYVDEQKIITTKEKYYVLNNIDWTQEHTIYVKELAKNSYISTSKKYKLKSGDIPKIENPDNPHIFADETFLEASPDIWAPNGIIYMYYAFDKNYETESFLNGVDEEGIGKWIGYDFGKPVMVYEASGRIRMLGYKIQASNDKETWEDIVTASSLGSDNGNDFKDEITSSKGYRYWRLCVNGGQLQSNWSACVWELQFKYVECNIEN